ncbi:MAG TPA: ribose-5-phosphate isomerase RpiA [Lacipirellula sp.]|jgi:ribose 5-phosphate isomerase A
MEHRPSDRDIAVERKRAAARAAVAEVEDRMLVGLGTGTTTDFAIAALGERIAGGLEVTAVVTSGATERSAAAAGVPVRRFDALAKLDLVLDGADEVDPQLRAIKGKGGALLREKIVATAAERTIVMIDDSKQVPRLGRGFVPVEVLPFAVSFVAHRIAQLGAKLCQRTAGLDAYRTEQGNLLLDCAFGEIEDVPRLAAALSAIPGLLGHGLFLDEIDDVYVGRSDGVIHLTRGAP